MGIIASVAAAVAAAIAEAAAEAGIVAVAAGAAEGAGEALEAGLALSELGEESASLLLEGEEETIFAAEGYSDEGAINNAWNWEPMEIEEDVAAGTSRVPRALAIAGGVAAGAGAAGAVGYGIAEAISNAQAAKSQDAAVLKAVGVVVNGMVKQGVPPGATAMPVQFEAFMSPEEFSMSIQRLMELEAAGDYGEATLTEAEALIERAPPYFNPGAPREHSLVPHMEKGWGPYVVEASWERVANNLLPHSTSTAALRDNLRNALQLRRELARYAQGAASRTQVRIAVPQDIIGPLLERIIQDGSVGAFNHVRTLLLEAAREHGLNVATIAAAVLDFLPSFAQYFLGSRPPPAQLDEDPADQVERRIEEAERGRRPEQPDRRRPVARISPASPPSGGEPSRPVAEGTLPLTERSYEEAPPLFSYGGKVYRKGRQQLWVSYDGRVGIHHEWYAEPVPVRFTGLTPWLSLRVRTTEQRRQLEETLHTNGGGEHTASFFVNPYAPYVIANLVLSEAQHLRERRGDRRRRVTTDHEPHKRRKRNLGPRPRAKN